MAAELERIVRVADTLLLGSSPEPEEVARAEEDVTTALSSLSSRIRELAGAAKTEARDEEMKIDDDTKEDEDEEDEEDELDEELVALEAKLVARRRRLKELIDGVRDISADVAMWGVKERFHALGHNETEVAPSTAPPQPPP